MDASGVISPTVKRICGSPADETSGWKGLPRSKQKKKPKITKPKRSRGRGILVFITIVVVVLAVAAYIMSQPPTEPGQIGNVAPDFALPVVTADGLSGQSLTLSSFRGKVVILEFMVSWCHVCQQMAPAFEYITVKYQGQNVVFISVAATLSGATAESTAQFIRQYHATWTHVLDTNNSVFAGYKIEATPTYFVIDKSGEILSRLQGAVATDVFTNAIDLALS